MKKITLTSAFLALGLASASQAAIIFDTLSISDSGASNNLGQSFTATGLGAETKLSTIVLESANTAGTGIEDFDLTMNVYLDTNGNAEDWSQGALVATSDTVSLDTATDGLGTQYTFTFASLPTLTEGQVYLVDFTDTVGSVRIAFNGTNVSSSGRAFRNIDVGAGTASEDLNGDFAMQVNTAPEPSSTALLGLGGLALILRRHK